HAFDGLAENRVAFVQKRRGLQGNIKLGSAGTALRVYRVAGPRPGQGTFFVGQADLRLDGVAGAAGSVTLRIAALNHEARLDTVEGQALVIAAFRQVNEVVDGPRGLFRVQGDLDVALAGGNDGLVLLFRIDGERFGLGCGFGHDGSCVNKS